MYGEAEVRGRQRDHWNGLATQMPDFSLAPSTRYYRACEIALIKASFGDLRGKRLLKLDLWNEAFNTRILHWLRAEGADAHGIDVSLAVARRARLNAAAEGSDLKLLSGDIRQLPFRNDTFDLVYTMGTIEHIAEYGQAVQEIARVLRPGGRAIIGVPHKYDPWLRPALVTLMEALGRYPYSPEKSFSSRELRRVIEAAGLQVVERTGILTLPGVVRLADLYLHTRGVPLGRAMEPLMRPFAWLETHHRWAGRLGYLLTHVAHKPSP